MIYHQSELEIVLHKKPETLILRKKTCKYIGLFVHISRPQLQQYRVFITIFFFNFTGMLTSDTANYTNKYQD
jgi:hypothetical protein